MKKNRIAIILAIVMVAIAVLLIWNNRYLTSVRGSSSDFMVWDTAAITKVYLADRMDNETLLERTDHGWTLNKEYRAHPKKIEQLMYTLYKVRIRMPVSVASHDNVITQLAGRSTKVEIYQNVPRINLFYKIKLFYHEKCTKVFYVGESTQDSHGTFMLREGSDQPYIVHIPGFRGYISTRFTANPDDWRDHVIFRESLNNIQSASVEFGDDPMRSFRIDNIGHHSYKLIRLADNQELPMDTLKVINFLSAFNNINYETLLSNSETEYFIDSITHTPYLHVITLVTKDGREKSITTYAKRARTLNTIPIEEREIDVDHMFATINDSHDFVLIQYYTFDKLVNDVNYYVAGNPIQYEIGHFEEVK